jgi:hypothetical protein
MFRPKLNLVVIDPASGRSRPGAFVTIYWANTQSLAALYADDDVTALANPAQADALGMVVARVNPGIYDIAMTWEGAVPTIVEDVLAWTPEAAVIVEPGDLIRGAANGGPERLPVGADGYVLTMTGGLPEWSSPTSGLPAGVLGTMFVRDPAETVAALAPGTEGQLLAILGGKPQWATHLPDPPGTLLPISQRGDLVVGSDVGTPTRLARGATGQLLAVEADGDLIWIDAPTPPGPVGDMDNPMLALGDLIVAVDAAGLPGRLPIGTTGQVLTVVSGAPHWADAAKRRVVETTLPLEGARFPDGSAGNNFPSPIEWVSTGAPPATMPKITSFAYQFMPLLQQSLLWKAFVPQGYSGGAITAVLKWRAPGITGQIRFRVALGPVVDMGTDLTTTLVLNAPTVSAPQNLPGTANLQATVRLPLDQLANVAAGRTVHVNVAIIESGADPGAVILEQCWLEWTIDA